MTHCARRITHVLRAPIVGGSELETLSICRELTGFEHAIAYPARFANWEPSIERLFPESVDRVVFEDVDRFLRDSADLIHMQFPFIVTDSPAGHDSVLELRQPPPAGSIFTVHAGVNVPVHSNLHYVFHTVAQSEAFSDRIEGRFRRVIPSLIEPPPAHGSPSIDGRRPRVLWVSRNDEAKFSDRVPEVVHAVLERHPEVEWDFVGRPSRFELPRDPRVITRLCPVDDLEKLWASADVHLCYPHERVHETWGRTVTEAMARGVPCVVPSWGAMSEQIGGDRAGRTFVDTDSCIEAILELLGDPSLRAALGAEGLRRADSLRRHAASEWHTLYSNCFLPHA